MRRNHLICYDIADPKRLRKVAKLAYGYALGGQKSALEAPLDRTELASLTAKLEGLIDPEVDRVHIVPFDGEPLQLGKADFLRYENGVVLL